MQITFYMDILFILSFISNWVTLWITGKLIGKKNLYVRMIIGAGVSSLLFLLSLFCSCLLYGWAGIVFWIGVTVGIIRFVFGSKHLLRNWFYSTTTMFLIGSIMTNLKTMSKIQVISLGKWIALFMCSIVLIFFFCKGIYVKNHMSSSICNIMICNNKSPILIKGFEDSGNLLIDSYTGKSVLLIQSRTVKLCVDERIKRIIDLYEQTGKIDYNSLLRCNNTWGVHELSYQSVGAMEGRLLCVYLEEIYVNDNRFRKQPVAIVADCLFEGKNYQAIVNEKLL